MSTDRWSNARPRPPGATVVVAVLAVVALVAAGLWLALRTGGGLDDGPDVAADAAHVDEQQESRASRRSTGPADAEGPIRFARFPLDQGWEAAYGRGAIDGPDPGAGGISMPEGHCDEEVLFASGYRGKLSTYVTAEGSSRTRELLRYADARSARATFAALRGAVEDCRRFPDAPSGEPFYAAEIHDAIDAANAREGRTTLTFAYTTVDGAPFGILYQFALDRDVLYGSSEYGEWSAASARTGLRDLDGANRPLVSSLAQIER